MSPTRINLAATAPQMLRPTQPDWDEMLSTGQLQPPCSESKEASPPFRGLLYAMLISAIFWAGVVLLLLHRG
jgi:hypothetical protein